MPWNTDQPLPFERADFVEAVLAGLHPFAKVCHDFGISRKTGYKWLSRATQPQPQPLRDRSRRPRHSPRACPPAVEQAILDAHDEHPWGARKLHAFLSRLDQPFPVPSRGTVHAILRRHARVCTGVPKAPPQRFQRSAPNHLWQIDFKGPLPQSPRTPYLFTVLDDYSRYLVVLRLCRDQTMATVWTILWDVFGQVGLPVAILSDRGFAPRGPGGHGLSWLETRLERLGILHPHGRPRHPQTQGKVERYHRTVGDEVLDGINRGLPDDDVAGQLEARRVEYNQVRPHEGAGNDVPADRWWASDVARPVKVPGMTYPAGATVRQVMDRGEISWRGYELMVGGGMVGEPVRVEEKDREITIWYGTRRIRTVGADGLIKGRFN